MGIENYKEINWRKWCDLIMIDSDNLYDASEDKKKLYEYRSNLLKKKEMKDVSLITNTCIGGRLYHDYNHKFLSPTIDLYIKPSDFVKFCCNLKEYLEFELIEVKNIKINNFVVGKLKDINIYFSHTNYTFDIAKENWERRKKRINYDNIIVIATDRCTLDETPKRCSDITIQEFGKIPYKKVIFTTKEYPYNYCSFLKSFKKESCCPEATLPAENIKGKYILETDGFDIDKFISE